MKITPAEVAETATLARLALSADELKRLGSELDAILGYMQALEGLDVSSVEPTTHAVPLDCPLRSDEVGPELPTDVALADAPRRHGPYFEVPKIIEPG